MFSMKSLRNIVFVSIILMLTNTPLAIQAADQGGNAGSTLYLPAIFNYVSPHGSLSNGGIYVGEGGVGLGALANSLAGPIDVTIVQTVAPTQILPARAQILSDYYQVKASTDVALSTDSPLILAFPVPAGANTSNLALALLRPIVRVLDSAASIPAWTFLEGKYDPNKGLFLTTLTSLEQNGETNALVDHADFASPTNPAPLTSTRIMRPGALQFMVQCVNFPNPTDCTSSIETTVADELSQIYTHIKTELLFDEPRLRFLDNTLNFNPNSLSSLGYMAFIEPSTDGYCDTANVSGYYDPSLGRLVLCLDPAVGLAPNHIYTLIHEFFHATQYGYQVVYTEYLVGLDEKWSIEGQAMAAEGSYYYSNIYRETARGWSLLHKADVSLKSEARLDEYDAQDFWVYYGQHTHQGLEYLRNVLPGGVQATDVAKTIGSGDLLDPYWDWAKNQVMEADVDFLGALTTPCQLETNVLNLPERFDYLWSFKPYHDVTLDPLDSIVVDVRWDYKYDFGYGNVFAVPGSPVGANLALRFKLYEEGEVGCQTVKDGMRTYINPDPAKRYYVVVTNTSPTQTYTYRVGFEVIPIPPNP